MIKLSNIWISHNSQYYFAKYKMKKIEEESKLPSEHFCFGIINYVLLFGLMPSDKPKKVSKVSTKFLIRSVYSRQK